MTDAASTGEVPVTAGEGSGAGVPAAGAPAAGAPAAAGRRRARPRLRRVLRVVVVLVVVLVAYLGAVFVEVWGFGRQDQARPVDAIVVMGAAQYDGRPSPVLEARLEHALTLYRRGLAPLVVVTGGKLPGDRFTEAATSARYLRDAGVPADAIVQEPEGRTSWESLQVTARLLRGRGLKRVLLVSDPYHQRRIVGMARDLDLRAFTSPTRTSPEKIGHLGPHYAQETFGVAAAHLIGFRRLVWIDPA